MFNVTNIFKSLICFLIIQTATNAVFADSQESPKKCKNSPDEVSCLLSIAKIKSLQIKDFNDQVGAIAGILKTNTQLNRTDYTLLEKSLSILKDKKLSIENYLDLQIALATYFNKRDPAKTYLYINQATKVFNEAKIRNSQKERLKLATWACSLIDSNSAVWKITASLASQACTIENTVNINSDEDDYEKFFIILFSAWVQSDFKEFEKVKAYLEDKMESIESYGIKNNKKDINIYTQKFKVLNSSFQTSIYKRSGLQQKSQESLIKAKEALIGLEKLTNGEDAIDARITLASIYNDLYDYQEAINILAPISFIVEDEKKSKAVPLKYQVDYLLALAEAIDSGGFLSFNEIKQSRNDFRSRQADIIYQNYLALKTIDEKKGIKSEKAFHLLIDAAEAGNIYAMHNLALEYAYGNNLTPKDIDKALYWYSWSASLGFAGAQNNLGDLFEENLKDETQIGLAIYWYTQAAMQGEPTAYLSLGEIFFAGKGVPKNNVTASVWLTLAKNNLPNGTNKSTATTLLEKSLTTLDEKTIKYVESRVYNFVPLKQTTNKLSDKPKSSEVF